MTCNLSKYAYASVIEEQIVTEYREDMFEEIPETATLHWATALVLQDALVLTKIIVKKQNKAPMLGLSVFTFMDGIDAPHVTQTHTNVEPYIDKRHTWTAFLHYHKETQDIIQVVKRKDVAVAIPGRKTTAVAVHNKINELIEVLNIQAAIHRKMVDSGDAVEDIDPYDEKWEVDDTDIVVMGNHQRKAIHPEFEAEPACIIQDTVEQAQQSSHFDMIMADEAAPDVSAKVKSMSKGVTDITPGGHMQHEKGLMNKDMQHSHEATERQTPPASDADISDNNEHGEEGHKPMDCDSWHIWPLQTAGVNTQDQLSNSPYNKDCSRSKIIKQPQVDTC
ncbi:hypothetical protein L208DRAFT_1379399 [Tricholoma matsutake]|nr:hypothetical protein L208DRAFT_1379399 [Tricholoma matsutake 945]